MWICCEMNHWPFCKGWIIEFFGLFPSISLWRSVLKDIDDDKSSNATVCRLQPLTMHTASFVHLSLVIRWSSSSFLSSYCRRWMRPKLHIAVRAQCWPKLCTWNAYDVVRTYSRAAYNVVPLFYLPTAVAFRPYAAEIAHYAKIMYTLFVWILNTIQAQCSQHRKLDTLCP